MAKDSILQISKILDDYSLEIQEAITKEVQKVAREGKQQLNHSSPKQTGDYRKGWKVQTTKGFGFIKCVIHNKTDYRLTHLLEKPHATRNGGRTTPKVHIKPVEEYCNQKLEENITNIIKNGG